MLSKHCTSKLMPSRTRVYVYVCVCLCHFEAGPYYMAETVFYLGILVSTS